MNGHDRWLEEGLDEAWEDCFDEDPRMEFCQDEYMTNEEIRESLREAYLEDQYELYCNSLNTD